jgi:iron complex outermembrane recepter protein
MRKRISNLLTFLLLTITSAFAQNNTTISGTVVDKNNKAIQSVTVSLLKAIDSSLVKTAITDNEGKFELTTTKKEKFIILFSGVGFQNTYSNVLDATNENTLTVPTITLQATVGNLKEVVVTSKKPLIEVKADKTIFNVEASINATGSDALELLKKSPGVQVDNNENISMKGKTGVRIYVDGKMMQLDNKDLAAYLKSINSNDIEAIEMISNPSAKYDASGNAGIVNIRLKKNKKYGTNGSVTGGFIQGITPKGNGSVNLNYRDKKVNLFGNVGGNIGINENALNLYRIQQDTLYDQKSINQDDNKSINAKIGADFFINKKNTLGFLATTNYSDVVFRSTGNTDIYFEPTNTFVKKLQALNTIPGTRTNANFNINYRYVDTNGTEINFDADYGIFRGTGRSYQPNYYVSNNNTPLYSVINRNFTPTDINIYTAKVDVEQKLGKGKLGYGAKTSFVNTTNTFDFFNDNTLGQPIKVLSRSNSFTYDENVNALYANYQQQLNEKWSFQGGLRMEQTNSKGVLTRADGIVQADNTVKRSYLDFFPSAAVTFNINAKHSLNLTYSKRIDRPTYQDLNPFENKLDELTYEKGNAFLQPQYTNTIELTHTFMGFINTTVGYSHVRDYATQATDTLLNATYVQQKNLASQKIINFNIGAPTPINKWWNGYVNLWYNYQFLAGTIGVNKVNVEIPSYGAYVQQSFTLGKDYSAEISGWYNGPSVWGGTWKTRPQGGIDLGAQKQILKKTGSIRLAVTDILFTAPWTATNRFGGVNIRGGGNWESRTARLSFTWRFGSNQIKKSRERQTGLESESKRIKGAN